MKKFCKEYLALQIPQKYLICAWKLSLNEGNYALIIDGGRQTDRQNRPDRQTDRVSYRGASLLKKTNILGFKADIF